MSSLPAPLHLGQVSTASGTTPIGGYGTATNKVPPEWDPAWSKAYPFRTWLQDVLMWAAACDLDGPQQGPAVIMRLGGAARAMCRTIDTATAINGATIDLGDGNGLTAISGLAVVLRGLGKEFAPLDYETSVSVMAEYLAFKKLASESIDGALSRFATVRQKARAEGHQLPPAFQSYLLLTGLHVQPLMWSTFLQPLMGRLPVTDDEMTQLTQYIRRQGHLLERGNPLTDNSNSNQPTYFAEEQNAGLGQADGSVWLQNPVPFEARPQQYMPSYPQQYMPSYPQPSVTSYQPSVTSYPPSVTSYQQSGTSYQTQWDWNVNACVGEPGTECPTCGMYIVDECDAISSSATSEEQSHPERDEVLERYAQYPDQNLAAAELRDAYYIHRKRWRRFTGKFPRTYRRPFRKGSGRKGFGKGYGKNRSGKGLGYGLPGVLYTSDPQGHYWGKKGGGKHFDRVNPTGKDGQPMKCFRCGSDRHLASKCHLPRTDGKGFGGGGSGSGKGYYSESVQPQVPNSSYLMQGAAVTTSNWSSWFMDDDEDSEWIKTENASSSSGPSCIRLFDLTATDEKDFTSSSSMKQCAVVPYKRGKGRDKNRGTLPTVSQVLGNRGNTVEAHRRLETNPLPQDEQREPLLPAPPAWNDGLLLAAIPPPGVATKAEKEALSLVRELQAATGTKPGLSTFYIEGTYSDEVSRNIEGLNLELCYLHQPRLHGQREGLLVDPGAHSNLCGDRWLARVGSLMPPPHKVTVRPLKQEQNVRGVGQGSQRCTNEAAVPIALPNGDRVEYTAPIVPHSDIPALLGLKSLKMRRCVMDCYQGILYEIAPGTDYRLYVPVGSKTHRLMEATTGHWLLPVTDWPTTASPE